MKLLSLFLVLILSGCATSRLVETIVTKVDWVKRDSIVAVPARVAEVRVPFEIKNGKVEIGEMEQVQKAAGVKPSVKLVDNYVYLECEVDSMGIYLSWKERHEKQFITKKEIIKKKSLFEGINLSIALIAFVAIVVLFIIKKFFNLFKF